MSYNHNSQEPVHYTYDDSFAAHPAQQQQQQQADAPAAYPPANYDHVQPQAAFDHTSQAPYPPAQPPASRTSNYTYVDPSASVGHNSYSHPPDAYPTHTSSYVPNSTYAPSATAFPAPAATYPASNAYSNPFPPAHEPQTLYDQPFGADLSLHQMPSTDAHYDADQSFGPMADPAYGPQHDSQPLLQQPISQQTTLNMDPYHDPFAVDAYGQPVQTNVIADVNAANIGGFDPNVVGAGAAGFDYSQDPDSYVRYGRIPQRQPRRYKTVKRVELYKGNLVLDCQVPPKLLQMCPRKTEREFTHMRYTAATCDPNDFAAEHYTLRQNLYDTKRSTELFIVLTMYNEDEVLFCRTMHGVMKNIQHLCSRTRSKRWGENAWKKVVVCVVSDGRKKINSRTLSVLAALGVYQDGVAKNFVAGKPVTSHIYEYTTQVSIDPDLKLKTADRGIVPVQVVFCLKEKNAKKINSHRWFFNAFGPVLNPNVCVLLDVGTQPGPTSIYKLWKTFDINSNVGGACGEIVALKGKYFQKLLNPVIAAQNFEYKMSNILDKPTESVFGYITVLPGAFSAYRYIALQNDPTGKGPLCEYFKGETLHHSNDADLWTKNMYLAEDRILCWELVAKRKAAWILHYQRSAYAVTDVPETLPSLISQRRRWLNGSFFAGIHSTFHFGYLYRSDHTFMRKLFLHFEAVYQLFNMVFTWFGLGNYYIMFYILITSMADKSYGLSGIKDFNIVLEYYYVALLIVSFLLALGNRPQGSRVWYAVISVSYAIITAYMTFAAFFISYKAIVNVKDALEEEGKSLTAGDVFTNSVFRNIVVSLLSTYGLYILASIIFLDPMHMITSFIQYLLFVPTTINVLNVYAFCNVQDVTWGNRPEEKASTDLGAAGSASDTSGVDLALPTDEKDINAAYDDAIAMLSTKPPPEDTSVDAETKMTDSYRTIRTNVVLAWTLSNGGLVAGILSTAAGSSLATDGTSSTVNGYMMFLLYAVAGLAAFRFVGCVTYSILWLFQR